jgi:hypothetical protein
MPVHLLDGVTHSAVTDTLASIMESGTGVPRRRTRRRNPGAAQIVEVRWRGQHADGPVDDACTVYEPWAMSLVSTTGSPI